MNEIQNMVRSEHFSSISVKVFVLFIASLLVISSSILVEANSEIEASSYLTWMEGDPFISVWASDYLVGAENWPFGAELTLTIDNPYTPENPDETVVKTLDPDSNYIQFQNGNFDIQPGYLVSVTDGTVTKEHTVLGIGIDPLDLDLPIITGYSPANQEVSIILWHFNDEECDCMFVIADSNGMWTADFRNVLDNLYDIGEIQAFIQEDDGDRSGDKWWPPFFQVIRNENYVRSWNWQEGVPVELSIVDPVTGEEYNDIQVTTKMDWNPAWTYVEHHFDDQFDVQPHQIVTLRYDVTVKQHTVTELVITSVNIDTDIISGIATPGAEVFVEISDHYDCDVYECPRRSTSANLTTGIWSVDFSTPGEHWWESQIYDVTHGTFGEAAERETGEGADGDYTVETFLVNQDPICGEIVGPLNPLSVGSFVEVSANFTDPNIQDTHEAIWIWEEDVQTSGNVIESNGLGTAYGRHVFNLPGVYAIDIEVFDNLGGSCTPEEPFQYAVLYDPEGGFVTGGGWIWSPFGAYASDSSLEGKATFGFVSKYKKGTDVPTGQTQFQFKVADLNFHSDAYDWLVVAGSKAQFKGVGTINGEGVYKFILTAIDADLNENDAHSMDKFRIRIWTEDESGIETVIYDNGLGADEYSDTATKLEGGSIVIHTGK